MLHYRMIIAVFFQQCEAGRFHPLLSFRTWHRLKLCLRIRGKLFPATVIPWYISVVTNRVPISMCRNSWEKERLISEQLEKPWVDRAVQAEIMMCWDENSLHRMRHESLITRSALFLFVDLTRLWITNMYHSGIRHLTRLRMAMESHISIFQIRRTT